jgi:hypothetical protein
VRIAPGRIWTTGDGEALVFDLQVPTRTVAASFRVAGPEWTTGFFYPADRGRVESESDALLAMLNDERAFIPFRTIGERSRGGRSLVLGKEHLLQIRLGHGQTAQAPREGWDEEEGDVITAYLSDGSTITGVPLVMTPSSDARSIDKLNRAGRFMPFRTSSSLDLVQSRHIVRVE